MKMTLECEDVVDVPRDKSLLKKATTSQLQKMRHHPNLWVKSAPEAK